MSYHFGFTRKYGVECVIQISATNPQIQTPQAMLTIEGFNQKIPSQQKQKTFIT